MLLSTRLSIAAAAFCISRTNYIDLLLPDAGREVVLRKRIDDQHRIVTEEIRSGALRARSASAASQGNPAVKRPIPRRIRMPLPAPAFAGVDCKELVDGKAREFVACGRPGVSKWNCRPGALVTAAELMARAVVTEFRSRHAADGQARLSSTCRGLPESRSPLWSLKPCKRIRTAS